MSVNRIKLRDYQKKGVNHVEQLLERDNRAMLCLATGGGKSYTFCEIARRFFLSNIKKVLILVHRKELLQQAHDSLGERCFKIADGVRTIPDNYDFYVGMVETVNNRIGMLPEFGLVIIDEAHIGNFNKLSFFDDEDVKILGVSATPTSSNHTKLSDLYKNLIETITIKQLIKRGYLVEAENWAFASQTVGENTKNWKLSNGDYQLGQMGDFYSSVEMIDTALNAYWKHSAGKKTMIFNVNINHNLEVYKRFKQEGLNVYSVDSTLKKSEREIIIEKFKNDPHGIMCNVGVLTTGFDCPSIETIILNRATKSLILYLQMVGRGARPAPGKEKFKILDLGNNVLTHGYYSDWRDWEKLFKESKTKGDGEAPVKECPKCGYICHTSVRECPACGHIFEKKDPKKERFEELVRLKNDDPFDMDLDVFFSIGREKGWNDYAYAYKIADHLVNYQKRHLDILNTEDLMEIGAVFFERWLEHVGKKKTQWNKNFFFDAILKKQKERGITKKLKEFHNENYQLKLN